MNFGFEDRIAGASFWLHTWWIYVTVVWSQNDLDIPHLQTHQVKKKPVQRLILMCLVYDRKLTFCHFVLLQTLKTRALSRVQTKGFIFLLLRVIFRTGSKQARRAEFFTSQCQCWAPHTECQYTGICSVRKIRFFGVRYSKMFAFKSCTNRKTFKSFLTDSDSFQGSYLLLRQISEIRVEWVQRIIES